MNVLLLIYTSGEKDHFTPLKTKNIREFKLREFNYLSRVAMSSFQYRDLNPVLHIWEFFYTGCSDFATI